MDRKPIPAEHIAILFEDMNSKFHLILEGQDSLRQELTRKMENMDERISSSVAVIEKAVSSLSVKISHHENRIGKLEKSVYH